MRSNEASLHDVRILAREIKRRCAEHHITVRFQDGIDTAYSSDSEIVIPTMELPLTNEKLQLIRYYTIHEVGHHLRKRAFELLAEAKLTNKNAHACWNMLEDEQLEREAQRKFEGDRKSVCIGRDLHIRDMLARWNRDSDGGRMQPCEDTAKGVAVHAVCCASREYHPHVEHLVENMLMTCGPKVREWYETLLSEGWGERIATPMNEEDTRDLAMELFARLFPEEAQQNEQETQQNEGGEGEENQEDGEGEGENRSKNGKPSSQEHGEAQAGDFSIPWTELVGSEHSDDSHPHEGKHEIDFTGWKMGDVSTYPDSAIEVCEDDVSRGCHHFVENFPYNPDTTFANQMRRHIQSEARDRWETNRKTGRLNVRAIKRIKTGTREHNRRIFKRRFDHEAINTCITVLVDWSGSMNGHADEIAANAAGLLVDSFDRVLGVPVEVLGHTTGRGGLRMLDIKKFNERIDGDEVCTRLKKHDQNGNADGDALLYAWDRIKTRPEKRKIIIAIADGQPADVYDWSVADPGSVLAFAIDQVRKSKVEVYGIGAGHRGIRDWYGEDSEVVMDLSEMSRTLLRVAEKFVLKG